MTRTGTMLALAGLLWGCPQPVSGPGPAHDGGATDGGVADAGLVLIEPGDGGSSNEFPDGGGAILAPARAWAYVPFPDAQCGNGTETGIGVNLSPGSKTLLVFIQGGGACWEVGACYVLKSAVHVEDTVQAPTVLAEAQDAALKPVFDRTDPSNPLRDAHQVYMPYCTGDLHQGTHVQRYEALGQTRDLHHVGALNQAAFWKRLAVTFPDVERVVVAGISAGGYGAALNAWRVQQTFGTHVRVDLLDDSGILVAMESSRFGAAVASWQPVWPPSCTACAASGYPALLASNAHDLNGRMAYLANRQDGTIGLYFGLTGDQIAAGLDAQRAAAGPNQFFYLVDGTAHVVLASPQQKTSTGVVAEDWLHAFETDGGALVSVGP